MWPTLLYEEWKETQATLHMWMQVVGKVKLELAPFINQWWEVAFYLTAKGITTGLIPFDNGVFQVDFNFRLHTLSVYTSSSNTKEIELKPQTVSDFYYQFMEQLKMLGIHVSIWAKPVEVQHPIDFDKDTKHKTYDKELVKRWWQILINSYTVLNNFRSSFRGKSSPIQFFWGSFDLAGTRFSGKKATPPHMNGTMGKIMHYAENEENFAFGFWPGDEKFPYPAYYSYLYPEPSGFETILLKDGTSFNEMLGECILPYEVVRRSSNPEKSIRRFLDTTYSKSASLAGWNMKGLQAEAPSLH